MSDDTGCAPEGVNRFEWERRFRSSDIPATTKLVGLTMSTYASRDGTNMHPGVRRLMADCGILSDKTVRKHVAALADLGWVERTFHGSSAGRKALADVYRLTAPIAAARKWDREEHRYFDQASPVDGSLTPVTRATAHHEESHHEVPLHSARLALAHDKSRADTERQREENRVEATDQLNAYSLLNYGNELDVGELQRIESMAERGYPVKKIVSIVKRIIDDFEAQWPTHQQVERDWAASADCPF